MLRLKLCPFCGSQPVIVSGGEDYNIPECPDWSAVLPAQSGKDSEAKAIAAWNTRVDTDTRPHGHWIYCPQPDDGDASGV